VWIEDDGTLPVRGELTARDGLARIAHAAIWCEAREDWRPMGRDLAFPSQWIAGVQRDGDPQPAT